MHKFLYLSFASAVIFGLGVVSGNLARHERGTKAATIGAAIGAAAGAAIEPAPQTPVQIEAPDNHHRVQPAGAANSTQDSHSAGVITAQLDEVWTDGGVVPVGYEQPASASSGDHSFTDDFPVHAAALPHETKAATTEKAEEIIREYFPNVEQPVLTGWLEAYAGLSQEDLHGVMQQRTLLTGELPHLELPNLEPPNLERPPLETASSNLPQATDEWTAELLPQPLDASDLPPWKEVCDPPDLPAAVAPPVDQTSLQIIATARENLRHLVTVGFRRSTVRTQMPVASTAASCDLASIYRQFDLAEGRRQASPDPLHVAVACGGDCMFVLEPGHIVTRNGQFQLSQDGRIGLPGGDDFLAVKGTTAVPAGATNVHFSADGTVHYRDLEGQSGTAGAVELVRVHSPAALTSANGVYFRLAGDGLEPAVSPVEQAVLHLKTVELSNVDIEQEQALIEHFRPLATAAGH